MADSVDDSLTPSQRAAVEHAEGPLLVIAGPGSGKTRVVTHRIARLVDRGVAPHNILAITFTNKAAREMSERTEQLLPGSRVWISTFHRFCARLLRRYASSVGLTPQFSILDTSDQRQLLRRILSEMDFDTIHFSPDKIAGRISNAKNDLIDAEAYAGRYQDSVADLWQAVVAAVYPEYQRQLLAANSVDFDDLLLAAATLLRENPELRADLDDRFRYIMVDEYQDTNRAQYEIVAALSQDAPNLCVTGDADQSIYGWRGARIENILRFERDFPDATVVRLEENFRSTQAILRSADRLIGHNRRRKAKQLTTANREGDPVELLVFPDEHAEARGIVSRIQQLVDSGQRQWQDFAVFVRVNALSRPLELALLRAGVPFQVAAGVAFYDRAEIKDLLSYLRLVQNPADRAAFLRVVNRPLRGLGETSQRRLVRWADEEGIPLLEAASRASEVPELSKRAVAKFRAFAKMIADLSLANTGSVGELLEQILERTGYTQGLADSDREQDQQRLAIVEELLSVARGFDEQRGDESSLEAFLEQCVLVSDTDVLDDSAGQVTLMTLHAAKGLEFPVVFILGLEQGLLPHERALREADPHELEEERRLLFVGMTRARERLCLTQTEHRTFRGRSLHTIPSEFLPELEYTRVDVGYVPREDIAERQSRPPKRPIPGGGIALTTAAELLNGTKQAAEVPRGLGRGAQVRHPRYGLGTVVDIGGFGQRRTVTVMFRDSGVTETFVASKAPLEPLGTVRDS